MGDTANEVTLRLERMEGPEIDPIVLTGAEPVILGRSHLCTICLQNPGISRQHASLERRGDEWFVTDLGSRHGTYLNTVRLTPKKATRLRHQDFLTMEPWAFFALCGGATADSGYRSTDIRDPRNVTNDAPAAAAVDEQDADLAPTIVLHLGRDGLTNVKLSRSQFSERYGAAVIGFARNAGASVGEAVLLLHDVTRVQFRIEGAVAYDPAKGHFRSYLRRLVLNVIRNRAGGEQPTDIEIDRLEEDPDATNAMWNWQWTKLLQQRAMDEVRPRFEKHAWEAFERYGRGGAQAESVAEELGKTSDEVRATTERVATALREVVDRIRDLEG